MPRLSKIGAAALAAFGWTGGQTVSASYLVVAGGGGGGYSIGGGGGAGGYRTGTTSLNPTLSYTVTVGAGGNAGVNGTSAGGNGSDSVFNTITSTGGGGGGGNTDVNGKNGGSGGGSTVAATAGNGNTPSTSPSQGNNGGTAANALPYSSAGGGGASAVGANANSGTGNGGAGTASSISGTSVTYAGGGGGGRGLESSNGTGGAGGGGNGGISANGNSGTANLGGGGGGGGNGAYNGGAGGSGVVIISYVGAQQFGGGVVTVSGSNTIHTFTTSGTLSPLNSLTASYLLVAGGAGGGGTEANYNGAGGGGAGGLLSGSGITIDTNSIYAVTVGAGGAGGTASTIGVNGSNSIFSMVSTTAVGGGGGGSSSSVSGNRTGANGGSGGGGAGDSPGGISGGTGTSGQGNAGGSGFFGGSYGGGGGGGAFAVGQSASATSGNGGGNGGAGSANPVTGSTTGQLDSGTYYLAGGGAGGMYSTAGTGNPGTGGLGGGGNGGTRGGGNGFAGTANTGGGGGGATTSGGSSQIGGNGGAGVVIISYPGSTQQMAGGTVTVAGGNVIHTFTSSGYLTPIVLVNNSLRFRSSASAYLNRTFGSPTLSTKWTWSGWLKFGYGSSYYTIFDGGSPDTRFGRDPSTNQLYVNNDTTNYIITTPVYRDYSAWYHAVLAFDSSQGTASNRLRLYINGSEVTAFATDNRSSISGAIGINTATAHGIGRQPSGGSAYYDGYMAEINFIDGQALTPNSFGTFNGLGVWQPIRYGGSYGTNGFYLKFTDNSSLSALGTDSSGNSNTWTVNNFSVTSTSTAYDSMNDVPTLTSATVANYCVLSPLDIPTTGSPATLSDGNLKCVTPSSGYGFTTGTIATSSGKWYWEYVATAGSPNLSLGFGLTTCARTYGGDTGSYIYYTDGKTYANAGAGVTYGATWTNGDVIAVALDLDAGTAVFYKNNVSQGTAFTGLSGTFFPIFSDQSPSVSNTFTVNFGQRPFTYTPPTGFVALNTFNLPTPTIGATASTTANKYMDVSLYTGNGSTQSITGVGFQPDWVWLKARSAAFGHGLFDVLRGTTKRLSSDGTGAEGTESGVTAFNSDGFTIGSATFGNNNGTTMVGWQWKANGTGVSNTAGSITSTVSANTTAGFSVVTYTGTAANATVGHGLGVAPSMIITKNRDSSTAWWVYHASLGNTKYIVLNTTAAEVTSSSAWNNTSPTSTVFSLGAANPSNANQDVAYCFAPIAGYSAFGSYTGNGSSDGTFVFTGFRPRYVMIKRTNTTGDWIVYDSARSTYNGVASEIYPNLSNAEDNSSVDLDFVSNGIKLRNSGSGVNASGDTYIYACFAENPFKYANAR